MPLLIIFSPKDEFPKRKIQQNRQKHWTSEKNKLRMFVEIICRNMPLVTINSKPGDGLVGYAWIYPLPPPSHGMTGHPTSS